ncbi:hypothetical protein [Actinomyces polynesiensis]|uniref:hypothetical protein n=1 Tax=Actinomyces polynesiensis TaxID=1325934 RepID=UPI000694B364|nr:hypothetical protein [Actinomyces polynesiensis]
MTMTPEELLAGPRGRRLCLEWARTCEELSRGAEDECPLITALVATDRAADPGTAAMLVAVERRWWLPGPLARVQARRAAHRAADTRPPSSTELAGILERVPLREPDTVQTLRALSDATACARYWQPPDGQDLAAALPELRGPLLRVAEAILSSPAAAWWDSGIDRDAQWAQTFVGTGERPLFPERDVREVLDEWRAGVEPSEQWFRTWYDEHPGEDIGGSWWSIAGSELTSTTRAVPGGVPFGLWCVEDSMDPDPVLTQSVAVPEGARVLEVHGGADWVDLCRSHPLDVTWSRRCCWSQFTDWGGHWVIPDWRAVGLEWDAVHLTVSAWLSSAGRALDLGEGRASVIAGWDPDRAFWLCDVGPEDEVVEWRREQSERCGGAEVWHRAT